jgi:hypothetical protein
MTHWERHPWHDRTPRWRCPIDWASRVSTSETAAGRIHRRGRRVSAKGAEEGEDGSSAFSSSARLRGPCGEMVGTATGGSPAVGLVLLLRLADGRLVLADGATREQTVYWRGVGCCYWKQISDIGNDHIQISASHASGAAAGYTLCSRTRIRSGSDRGRDCVAGNLILNGKVRSNWHAPTGGFGCDRPCRDSWTAGKGRGGFPRSCEPYRGSNRRPGWHPPPIPKLHE